MLLYKLFLPPIFIPFAEGTSSPPLVMANPMAKGHVNTALDVLLEMDADGIGARTAEEISSELLPGVPGDFKAAMIVSWSGMVRLAGRIG